MNKVEESYRSPLTQDFYPTQISNYFTPLNVTKVERTLNKRLEDYCSKLYDGCISSVFFSDFNTSHLVHLMIRKQVSPDDYIKSGFYQIRVMIELSNRYVLRSGYLEYSFDIQDFDGSNRRMEGTIHMPDDQKTITEKQLDLKNFNYGDIGHMFSKIESQFYQTLVGVIFKARPIVSNECFFEEKEKSRLGSLLNPTSGSKKGSKSMLQAMGALALGTKAKLAVSGKSSP